MYCKRLKLKQPTIQSFTVPILDPGPEDKCNPSPCARDAVCNNGVCTCPAGLQGDPYISCRPECALNIDCPKDKACLRSKCADPCDGTCAPNAICNVPNHIPVCSCPIGMEGNGFIKCRPVQSETMEEPRAELAQAGH